MLSELQKGDFDELKCILSYLPSSNDEEKKVKRFTWKLLWKWTKICKPGFKLMPLNEVKKHFIRLDKKAFIELGVSSIQTKCWDRNIVKENVSDKKKDLIAFTPSGAQNALFRY